ncbi:efflux RND transporter permease subunit, partial [Steroidobacter sp.]|uniref:efflux RND transporter permease subunit n=1 Tax=Steroidobacter sp. TaxID=1978227 RepID=UPI001A3967A0
MRGPNLSEWALRNQQLVVFMLLLFAVAGIYAYQHLGRKEDPEFTFKAMLVQAYWPGASAEQMSEQVTDKLEKKLQEVAEIDFTRSYSRAGETQITVNLLESVPAKRVPDVWYQVRKKIDDVRSTLPSDLIGPFFNDEFGDTFGNIYAMTWDGFTYAEAKEFAEAARYEFLQIPDVMKVSFVGDQEEKIFIEASGAKLATLGLNPSLIVTTLSATNSIDAAGTVEGTGERVNIRVSGAFTSLDSIREIGIRAGDRTFRLGDIATVRRGYSDPPSMKMRFQGKEAIGIAVSMREGGDVIRLGRAMDATVKRLEQNFPVGIELGAVSDQPKVVNDSIGEFIKSLVEAVVIVLAVSFVALGLRVGLVVALSIPLVLAMTFLAMYMLDIDLQRVSLGALIIALGLLVDDAIIAVEMMALKLEQGWDRVKAATFAYTSTAFPMLTGTLITAASFLPIGLAKTNAGEYTFSIFQVVGISLMLSWIVAVVFTPYLAYKLLPEMAHHGVDEDAVYRRPLYVKFRALVDWCVEHRRAVVVATAALFVLSIALFRFVPQQFFPESDRPELMVDLWLPQGSSYAATEGEVRAMEQALAGNSDIVSVTSYVGVGSPRFYLPLDQQTPNLNFGQLVVMTHGEESRERVLTHIQSLFEHDFPLVRGRVTRLENGPPVGYPVQYRVSGPDDKKVSGIADQVATLMRAHPNVRRVNSDAGEQIEVMRAEIDQDKARVLGFSSRDIATTMQIGLSGLVTTQYREGDESIDVVARLERAERTDLGNLKDAKMYLPDGRAVALSQVAKLQLDAEESILWRRNRVPTVTVRSDVEGAQGNDVTKALQPQIDQLAASLPLGYSVVVAGSSEASANSSAAIAAVMPVALVIILVLLMVQLKDMKKMLLALATGPLGLIGVTAILGIFRVPFGFVAMLGVIALFGMILRNSVILIVQIDHDQQQGHSLWDAIVESAVRRLRPIMLTALAAILAMIPLTRSTFWGPMAWAIMGGLLVATLLTLLFLPALYAMCYGAKRPERDALAQSSSGAVPCVA